MTDDRTATATKGSLQELRTEMKGDMQELRTEMKGDMQELRTEMKGDMQELRTEMKGDMQELRTEMKGYVDMFADMFTRHQDWTIEQLAAQETRIIRHVGVLLEDLRHDFLIGTSDQLKLHAEQIAELQIHTGLRS